MRQPLSTWISIFSVLWNGAIASLVAKANLQSHSIEHIQVRDSSSPAGAQSIGLTSLYIAAHKGDIEEVRQLIQQGARIDERNTVDGWVDGWNPIIEGDETPLMGAIHGRHFEVVKFLIAMGADVNALRFYDDWHRAADYPLTIAFNDKDPQIQMQMIKSLVEAGAYKGFDTDNKVDGLLWSFLLDSGDERFGDFETLVQYRDGLVKQGLLSNGSYWCVPLLELVRRQPTMQMAEKSYKRIIRLLEAKCADGSRDF